METTNLYFPSEFPDKELETLSRAGAVEIVLAELATIAGRPATERAANLSLLSASGPAKKAGITRTWLTKMEAVMRTDDEQKARQAAIAAARQDGTMSKSDELWAKKAQGARYALPEGIILMEQNSGSYRLDDVSFGPIGAAIFPIEELENGTIRFGGWDRWGRIIQDLSFDFALLDQPKKCQTILSKIGARMDNVELWCAMADEIVSKNDLQVSDPEPPETENEEKQRIQAAIRQIDKFLRGDAVCVDPRQFEQAFGKLSLAVKRRWVERGWLIRSDDHHFTQVQRGRSHGLVRVYVFASFDEPPQTAAPTAGLSAVEEKEMKAIHRLN